MNRLLLALLSIAFFGLASCDNELDINADYEEIAIVYGLMDPKQDTQWVRVQRGYLGNAPASASFDEPDSLYYSNLSVELIEYDENLNETQRTPMVEDANSRQLSDGLFTGQGFSLYRTEPPFQVQRGFTYQVRISRDGEIIMNDLDDTAPVIEPTSGTDNSFSIVQPRQIPMSPQAPFFDGNFEWESSTAYTAAASYVFEYDEINLTTKQKTTKSFEFSFSPTRENSITYRFSNLYQAVASRLEVDNNVIRFFRKLSFRVTVANRELDTYSTLNQPTTGIIQSRPEYTNIINGLGVFSSRTTARRDSVIFTSGNLTSFAKSDVLCNLRFALVKGGTGDTVICNFVENGVNGETPISL